MSWLRLIRGSDAAVNLPETTTRPSACVVSHRVPDTQWELIAWERMDCVCYKLLVCLNNGPGVPVVASKAGYPDARYWPTGVKVTDAAILHGAKRNLERLPDPRPWNWCHKCRQPVDACDVSDGSLVRCWGCRRWFTAVAFEGGAWALLCALVGWVAENGGAT